MKRAGKTEVFPACFFVEIITEEILLIFRRFESKYKRMFLFRSIDDIMDMQLNLLWISKSPWERGDDN